MTWPLAARALAVAIAVAAAVDPAFTRSRTVPLRVSLVHGEADRAFAGRLRRAIDTVTFVDGMSPDSQATVVIAGAPLPNLPDAARVFVIEPPAPASTIRIVAFDVPAASIRGRVVPATAIIEAAGLEGSTVTLSLMAGGRLAAREERKIEGPRAQVTARLSFVPAAAGVTPLRLDVASGSTRVAADAAVAVGDRRLRVHVLDARPSWASTFVRRALEEDPSFDVSSSVTTSRGVATTSGGPARIDTAAGREQLDALVIGTLSQTPPATMRQISEFARVRGGAVVLLGDQDARQSIEQLTGIRGWQRRRLGEASTAAGPHGALKVTDVLIPLPSMLPATALATLETGGRPVVQEVPLGAGRVIVSGALDAWRHRGDPSASFGAFWRGVIGDAALAAVPPLGVRIAPSSPRVGETIRIEALIRDARPGEMVSAEAWLEHGGARRFVRLWPSAAPGVFTAAARVPDAPGPARIRVTAETAAGARHAESGFLVVEGPRAAPVHAGRAALLASAHGGAYIPDGDAAALAAALNRTFPAHTAPVTSHPMRYAGWLLPFTLLLGIEWRWRRRHGLK